MSSKAQTREKDYERGLRIADRRKAMGLSQDELAHRVGIGRQALSAIENGGDFKTRTLDNLAIVLGVSVDFIMYGKNEENSELLSEAMDGCFQSNSNLVRKVITLSNKVYVDVLAEFSKDGLLIPKEITWEDGRKYEITRVKDKRRAASTRAGGVGERYTCVVDGKEIFLFYEDNNMWFMERAGA